MSTYTPTTALRPSSVKASLLALCSAERKVPAMLWGPPGVGKSQVVAQVADELGMELRDIRMTLLDPVDLRGLPRINDDGRTSWSTPDFLPSDPDSRGILFLDEINAAPPSVQAAGYQLVLDRKLGDYELPDGWIVVGAGNREGDRAVTHRMPTPLANRFLHVEVIPDLEDWVAWALTADVTTPVIAFLQFRPDLLHKFEPKSASKAFPTPRSWEMASSILKAEAPGEVEYSLLAGTVGEAAAAELSGFLRVWRKLPHPDSVLLDPENAEVPDDPATLYALTGALARKANEDNFEAVIAYANRLPAEFSVLLVRDATRRDPALKSTRAFIEWGSANVSAVL